MLIRTLSKSISPNAVLLAEFVELGGRAGANIPVDGVSAAELFAWHHRIVRAHFEQFTASSAGLQFETVHGTAMDEAEAIRQRETIALLARRGDLSSWWSRKYGQLPRKPPSRPPSRTSRPRQSDATQLGRRTGGGAAGDEEHASDDTTFNKRRCRVSSVNGRQLETTQSILR